ncbi:MAG: 2Fe-2S iron-sulfur cluster-binding protein [Pseudomonadota bacterium]
MTDSTITVRVWRGTDTGKFESHEIPARDNQTVLDAVTEVQRAHAPDLAYRFACRVGVCGSCAMTVNGRPRWTCRTHISRVAEGGTITVEPLRNLPRIRDLVCDMSEFFEKWDRVGRFEGTATREDPPARVDPTTKDRQAADAAVQCINCSVCYAACDVVSWDADYLGPAALNRAWTLANDVRAANGAEVRRTALGEGGCGSCHSHGACMQACPVGLSPTRSIAGLKRRSLLDLLGGG